MTPDPTPQIVSLRHAFVGGSVGQAGARDRCLASSPQLPSCLRLVDDPIHGLPVRALDLPVDTPPPAPPTRVGDVITTPTGEMLAVSAAEAATAMFTAVRGRRGKAGYDEDEVDEFLDRIVATLQAFEQLTQTAEKGFPAWHVQRAIQLLATPPSGAEPTARAIARAHAHAAVARELRDGLRG